MYFYKTIYTLPSSELCPIGNSRGEQSTLLVIYFKTRKRREIIHVRPITVGHSVWIPRKHAHACVFRKTVLFDKFYSFRLGCCLILKPVYGEHYLWSRMYVSITCRKICFETCGRHGDSVGKLYVNTVEWQEP